MKIKELIEFCATLGNLNPEQEILFSLYDYSGNKEYFDFNPDIDEFYTDNERGILYLCLVSEENINVAFIDDD